MAAFADHVPLGHPAEMSATEYSQHLDRPYNLLMPASGYDIWGGTPRRQVIVEFLSPPARMRAGVASIFR